MAKFHYDGYGINRSDTPHKERVLEFSRHVRADGGAFRIESADERQKLGEAAAAGMSEQPYSDEAKAIIGANIARILQLRRAPRGTDSERRYQTTWANKSDIGIFEVVRRMGREIEGGASVMCNDLKREGGEL